MEESKVLTECFEWCVGVQKCGPFQPMVGRQSGRLPLHGKDSRTLRYRKVLQSATMCAFVGNIG